MQTGKAAKAVELALGERGMSLKELSRRTGIEYHTVRNGVKQITAMQSYHFLRYAELLNIDLQGAVFSGQTGKKNTGNGDFFLQK